MTGQDVTTAAPRQAAGWRSQFGHPSGWFGHIVGWAMAVKNRERSEWVLSLLDLAPDARVLEIGFGPGADIARVARHTPRGFVAGVDHSQVMVEQARRRNRSAVQQGRVALYQAGADELPFPDQSFDVVFSINAAQFWEAPSEVCCGIRRVLRPGGLVALAVQPRNSGATEETVTQTGDRLVRALTAAGFDNAGLARRALKPVSTVCALARR